MRPLFFLLIGMFVLLSIPAYGAVCGDGVINNHEQCDDGNTTPGDGCSSTCRKECSQDSDCSSGLYCDTGECFQSCSKHCDCPQGEFCYYGICLFDPTAPVYCCVNAGCPPGRWCIDETNSKSTCAEDPGYVCNNACDCGPAHCCNDNKCVKDLNDPWSPGGVEVGPSCKQGVHPTYCCLQPECFAGKFSYKNTDGYDVEDFLCYRSEADPASKACGRDPCLYAGHCQPGESCVDTKTEASPAPGGLCSFSDGYCVSNAIAEAIFNFKSSDLLPDCDGCLSGQLCEAGWRPGAAHVVERIIATCGTCGDGICDGTETTSTCPQDCSCGNQSCDTVHNNTFYSFELDFCSEETEDCYPGCDPEICGDWVCQGSSETPLECQNCPQNCTAPTSDADSDGIPDGCDLYPDDHDNDGVDDSDDQCDDTDPGDIVNEEGCAIAQLCPCSAPIGEDSWKNQGAYSSCVSHQSELLLSLGLITEEEKESLVALAVESHCGQKEKKK